MIADPFAPMTDTDLPAANDRLGELVRAEIDRRKLRRQRASMDEFLADLDEFLDNQADADQPTGCDHPIPNEAMKLHMRLTALLAERND